MATVGPLPGDHRPDGPATVAYPDPFPARPAQPFRSPPSAAADDTDPATDRQLAVPPNTQSNDEYDPFAANAYRPVAPWYRKPPAIAALSAIVLAVAAVLIAAFLLLSGRWTVATDPDTETSPAPPADAGTSEPATVPHSSPPAPPPLPPPPPPPAPPAEQNPAPANPRNTYAPNYPRQTQDNRRHVTTPETRPPDVSVRPTRRPAFPGQPGEQ